MRGSVAISCVRLFVAGIGLLAFASLAFRDAAMAADTAQSPARTTAIDARHIVPAYNPALDAVRPPTGFGTGKIWHVGPTETYKKPSDVAGLVHDGDIVEIDAATYECDQSVRWTANNLTLVGIGGRAVLDATGCPISGGKGIWNPSGKNLVVANIEFLGAAVGDGNGAGIRYDGSGYLYITNSYFHNNQDGILYTPNQKFLPTNNIVIDRSEFAHNEVSSGQAHNMYINVSNSFVLRFSYSHEAVIGHEVKSRSYSTYILYNRIAGEADGTSSYNIDLPEGGLSYIIGNIIEKSPRADNVFNISYSVETAPNPVQELYIAYNTIVNNSANVNNRRVLIITNNHLAEARIVDNLLVGFSGPLAAGTGANKVQLAGNVTTEQPGFYDQKDRIYKLTAGSPAIDQAIDAGSGSGFPLVAKYQFVFPHGGEVRPVVGNPDVGAYEYVPGQKIVPAPSVMLKAMANPISFNATARLSWTAGNAEYCTASGGWSGERPISGSFISPPLTANTRFGLSCTGPSGTTNAAVSVTVNDSPQAAALGSYTWKEIPRSTLASVCPSRSEYPDIFGTTGCEIKDQFATGIYVPDRQRWYLIGGGGTRGYYGNEVYTFDLATMKPEQVTDPTHISDTKEYAPSDVYGSKIHMGGCDGILHLRDGGIAPAPRGVMGQAAYDPRTKKIILGPWGFVRGIGNCNGSTLGQYATDQWSFDPATNKWGLLAPADDRYGSTIPSTWFLDPVTGLAYNGDGSRVGPTRGAYLIDYSTARPARHW